MERISSSSQCRRHKMVPEEGCWLDQDPATKCNRKKTVSLPEWSVSSHSFYFFMVTNEFVSWRSNSLFPNEKNWDIFIEKKIYYSAGLEVHCMLCPSSDILIWLKIYLRHLWLNVKYRSQKNGVSVVKLFDFFHKD